MDLRNTSPSQEAGDPCQPKLNGGQASLQRRKNLTSTVSGHLKASVDGRHADLIVVATCFTTGLVDTVMFSGKLLECHKGTSN